MPEPLRQCIVCRQKKTKSELIRFVYTPEGRIEIDGQCSMSGRGFYICASAQCIERARKHDLASKVLKRPVPKIFYSQLASCYSDRTSEITSMQEILGFAARGRKLVFGVTAIMTAIHKGQVKLVVFDEAAGASTLNTIRRVCEKCNMPHIPYLSINPLARAVGKVNCRCVGVTDTGFAQTLRRLSVLVQQGPTTNNDNPKQIQS